MQFHPSEGGRLAYFGSFQQLFNEPRTALGLVDIDGGTVVPEVNPVVYGSASIRDLFIESNDRLTVFGRIDRYGEIAPVGHTLRMFDDGSLDSSYPGGAGFGVGTGALGGGPFSTLRLGDGRFVSAGDFDRYNGATVNRMARSGSDGTWDSTFVHEGAQTSGLWRGQLLALSDGKILRHGFTTGVSYGGNAVVGAARLNVDGSFDPTLIIEQALVPTFTWTLCVLEQSEGRLLLSTFAGSAGTFFRVTSSGVLDPRFTPGSGPDGQVNWIVGLPDGRVAIAGTFTHYNGQPANRIAILSADGVLDPTFAAPEEINDYVIHMILQGDGKLIAIGRFTDTPAPYAVRLTETGEIDPTFALRGITSSGLSSPYSRVALDTQGRVYLYGALVSIDYGAGRPLVRFGGVPEGPTIVTDPVSMTVASGQAVALGVRAAGTAPYRYEWRRFGVPVTEKTGSALVFNRARAIDSGSYTVVVNNGYGEVESEPAMLEVKPGFSDFQTVHFSAEQIDDPTVGGMTADPDGDGFVNLLEYASGSDPWQAGVADVITEATINGAYLFFTYTRRDDTGDLSYVVETSEGLATWQPAPVEIVEESAIDTVYRRVTVRTPLVTPPGMKSFVRLKVGSSQVLPQDDGGSKDDDDLPPPDLGGGGGIVPADPPPPPGGPGNVDGD